MHKNKIQTPNTNKLKFSFFSFQYATPVSELKHLYYSALYSFISARFEAVSTSESTIEFTVRQLFYIPYTIRVQCEKNTQQTQYKFIFYNEKFIVCSALFSFSSFSFFLWFSACFLVGFYVVHYLFFSSLCARIFKQIRVHEILDDTYTKEQLAWIENPNLCSACGSEITKYHSHCPECGLFLAKKTFSPVSATEQKYTITYTFVESYENHEKGKT